MLSTTQFSKPWIKPRSRQCRNSQGPCAFHVQQFGDAWRSPLDLSSSIYTGLAIRPTDAQWQIRIDRSNELLRLLESAQANDWQSFMTLDESWFYLWTSHEKIRFKRVSNPLKEWNTWFHSRQIKGGFRQLGWTVEMDCLKRKSLLSIT
jgi:hypothetical protein